MEQPLVIAQTPWYDRTPASPVIPANQTGIDFNLVPAVRNKRLTVALLGTARTPARQAELYGTAATQLIRIVAVDKTTGAVIHHHCEIGHAIPLKKLTQPDPPPPPPGVGKTNWVEFCFNMDLAIQLGMPKDAAVYSIFAWMEDVVSPVHSLILDEDKTRPGQPGQSAKLTVNSPINIRRTPQSPPRQDKHITLIPGRPEERTAIARVNGSIGPGVLPKSDAGVLPRPKYLVVLAITALDHQVAIHNVVLPPTFDETGAGEFDFDIAPLFEPPIAPQRVYVAAFAGATLATPIAVEPVK